MLEKKNWVEGTFTFSFLLTIIHRNSSQYWIVNDFFYYGLGSPLWSYLDIYVTNLGNKGQNLVHTQKHLITLHFLQKIWEKAGDWILLLVALHPHLCPSCHLVDDGVWLASSHCICCPWVQTITLWLIWNFAQELIQDFFEFIQIVCFQVPYTFGQSVP